MLSVHYDVNFAGLGEIVTFLQTYVLCKIRNELYEYYILMKQKWL